MVGPVTMTSYRRRLTRRACLSNVTDLLYQKEIEVGERINLHSSSVATIDINSESSITVAEEEVTK